ncbi:FMN-binding negative transcriptional regulator [Glacieibacterium sp.]|uniref:FMN-binding negative transcriptional regulator n=1 Tax=Glacieibacterium sp. TaxID=2860237 RepID=UPI003B007348
MHPSPAFAWDDRAAALAFVAEVSFAHVFLQTPLGPRVAHVPVLVAGETLRFHLANSNALTSALNGATALASVGGPGHYVSPNWYADERGQVPTWNYLAVECEGPVRRMSDGKLVDLLDATTTVHEARVGEDWTRAKMDPRRFAAMCGAITGFELSATVIRATRKLSQNKGEVDVRGVVAGLQASGQADAAAVLVADRGW